MENRIKELDGLRGLAVVIVMAIHVFRRAAYFTKHPTLLFITRLTSVGWVGVDIFFTLSGFLITTILLSAKHEESYFKNFYVRRVLRIFPLYYVAIVFVLLFAPKVEPKFMHQLGMAIPIMLLYQQNWAILVNSIHMTLYLGITWSLAVEEQFYFLWPLAVYYLRNEKLFQFGLGFILLSISSRVLGVMFWPNATEVSRFFYYSSFSRFEEIIIGGLLAILLTYDQGRESVRRFSVLVFVVSFSVFVALCIYFQDSLDLMYAGIPLVIGGYTSAALFSAGLIGIFTTRPPGNILRKLFRNPALVFFGKYSYSMYLFHMVAALILLDLFWHTGMRGWKPYVLYIGSTYAATVMIALLTWNLVEKHVLGLKKYFSYKKP